jgi:hypothetical protein
VLLLSITCGGGAFIPTKFFEKTRMSESGMRIYNPVFA